MKQTITNKLRDYAHIFILGNMLSYLILSLTGVSEYTGIGNIIGIVSVAIIIATAAGFILELLQEHYAKGIFNEKDILRTSLGGVLGGVTAFFVDNDILFWSYFIILALTTLYEINNLYKSLNK